MSGQSQYLLVGGMMIVASSVSGCNTEPDSGDGTVETLLEEGESTVPLEPAEASSCRTYKAPNTASLGQCADCSICLPRAPAAWTCTSWVAPNGTQRWNVTATYTNGESYTTGCK